MKILFKSITVLDPASVFSGKNADVLVDTVSGKIEKITAPGEILEKADRTISGENKLLTPAFYNAHCHSAMTLFRGYGEDLPLDRWLNEKIFPAEARLTNPAIRVGSMVAIAEMIAAGVVSFTDMYEKCDITAEAVIETGVKANISRAVLCFDPTDDMKNDTRMAEADALFRAYHGAGNGRVMIDAAIHAEYTNTPNSCRAVADFAAKNNLRLQVHVSETEKEHEECIGRWGMTPTAFLKSNGVFDVPVTAAHCVYLTDDDIRIMAESGATAAHNPVSNLKLGSGVMRLRQLLDGGVNVALGTDGASSNNKQSVLREFQLAAILHKGVNRQADIVTSAELLPLISRNGALSQGREDCGLIAEGARADLVMIDMDKINNIPVYDYSAALCYNINESDVVMTMCDGRILYENGEYTTIDMNKLKYEMKQTCLHYFD